MGGSGLSGREWDSVDGGSIGGSGSRFGWAVEVEDEAGVVC